MTFDDLMQNVSSIDEVWVKFKQIGNEVVLIFWEGQSPIASIYTNADEYNVGYPKLLEMDLEQILQLNDWLYEFSQTDLVDRKLPF